MNKMSSLVKAALAILFLLCLAHMPYGYYQFIRFAGMCGFAWLAYEESSNKEKGWMIVWGASALLINPFLKVSLGRVGWNVVDVIWAIVLLYSLSRDLRKE